MIQFSYINKDIMKLNLNQSTILIINDNQLGQTLQQSKLINQPNATKQTLITHNKVNSNHLKADSNLKKSKSRADIDGLRGFSILFVVLYHSGIRFVGSGYLGVNIFFVISGYLISHMIFSQIEQTGSFSYSNFYSKRIKRIFPSFIIAMLFILFLYGYCTNPNTIKFASQSMISGILMSVNLHQMYKRIMNTPSHNYFLMLWSLGVQQQFYLFWPLLAGLLWKIKSMTLGLIYLAAIFIFNYILQHHIGMLVPSWTKYEATPGINYYHIIVGCILAYIEAKHQKINNTVASDTEVNTAVNTAVSDTAVSNTTVSHTAALQLENRYQLSNNLFIRSFTFESLLSFIGVYIIIYSLQHLKQPPYHSMPMLLAVDLASAFIISSKKGIINEWILGNQLMIFIGKVSYSWYLFHYAFLHVCNFYPNKFQNITVSFIIGTICMIWVQNKIRFRKEWFVTPLLIVAMIMLLILAIYANQKPENIIIPKFAWLG